MNIPWRNDAAGGVHMPDLVETYPVVLSHGQGARVWDVNGRAYLDFLAGYGAVNQGHAHPRLVAAMTRQVKRLTMIPRVFHHDQAAAFYQRLSRITGYGQAVLMNSGAEAVETAIKLARRWGYVHKGIAKDRAEVLVFDGNFHGRTLAAVGLSASPKVRRHFGPHLPGVQRASYGDLDAASRRMGPTICAVLVEAVQGQGGVVVPPADFLPGLRALCDQHQCLLMVDEVQAGLGRTGHFFAFQHSQIRPDVVILGKSLAGGMLPVSAVVADPKVMAVWDVGSHGSTFGGNPLACALAYEALGVIEDERLVQRAADLGAHLQQRLAPLLGKHGVTAVRSLGLWAGIQLVTQRSARELCARLVAQGLLVDATGQNTIRLSPPLVIEQSQLDAGLDRLIAILQDGGNGKGARCS